jgi:hypothetical protein
MLILGSMSALTCYLEKLHSVFLSVSGERWSNDFQYSTFQILTYSLFIIILRHLMRDHDEIVVQLSENHSVNFKKCLLES